MGYNYSSINQINGRGAAGNSPRPYTRKDDFLMPSHVTPNQTEQENNEEWRDVPGYEGCYQVSSLGRVRSLDRTDNRGARRAGRMLRPGIEFGYYYVHLSKDANKRVCRVHALVAAAFLGQRPKGYSVNHIDAVKTNNCAVNLEYISHGDNIRHAAGLGLMGKLSVDQVLYVRDFYASDPNAAYSVLAEEFEVSTNTIAGIARARTRAGIVDRNGEKPVPIYRRKLKGVDVYGLYQSGMSLHAIARQFGVNVSAVSRAFHKAEAQIKGHSKPLTARRL